MYVTSTVRSFAEGPMPKNDIYFPFVRSLLCVFVCVLCGWYIWRFFWNVSAEEKRELWSEEKERKRLEDDDDDKLMNDNNVNDNNDA